MARNKDTDGSETNIPAPTITMGLGQTSKTASASLKDAHPSGKRGHGKAMQILRGVAFTIYFLTCCVTYVCCLLCFAPCPCSPLSAIHAGIRWRLADTLVPQHCHYAAPWLLAVLCQPRFLL